jgi:hypothetical protein
MDANYLQNFSEGVKAKNLTYTYDVRQFQTNSNLYVCTATRTYLCNLAVDKATRYVQYQRISVYTLAVKTTGIRPIWVAF